MLLRVYDLRNRLAVDAALLFLVFDEGNLGIAPGVKMTDLMDALDGTRRSTPFFCVVLAIHVFVCIFQKRNSGSAALLRAPVDHTEFVDVEISSARSATPFVFAALDKLVLEPIPACVRTCAF